MRIVYGSPLPPGVEAPTRGELRIRVEKLLLKDGLVHTCLSSNISSAGLRPYTIPVDECAVGPLFWGEQQSSCHCLPATPGKPRGAVSLVYPVKTYEQQFNDYLTYMSSVTQCGLQLTVFVPTSYSGRHKPIIVGKAIVVLDALKPSSSISGWFPIMSDEVRSIEAAKDGGESQKEDLIEVGKIKVTLTLTFFTRAAQSPMRPVVRSTSVTSNEKHAKEEKSGRSQSKDEHTLREPHTSSPTTVVNPDITVVMDTTQAALEEQGQKVRSQQKEPVSKFPTSNFGGAPVTGMRESQNYSSFQQDSAKLKLMEDPLRSTLPCASVLPTMESNQKNAICQLIQKGLNLREKMSKALLPYKASESLSGSIEQPLKFLSPTILRSFPNYIPTTLPSEQLMDNIPISSDTLESSVNSANDESMKSTTDDDVDAIQGKAMTFSKEQKKYFIDQTERHCFKTPFQHSVLGSNEKVYVEVDISKIAFSSGRATLGMEEMRVGIRLSKDVNTDEPVESYSSYVHRVPLARGANHHIVIGFSIRSFSKDRSRMVISFYRVRSAPVANPPGELLLPPPASAQRVLVEETLLGMCIVGLHDQSRDIVLHDPITGEDPTQAYIHVSLRKSEKQPSEEQRVNENLAEKVMQRQQKDIRGRERHGNAVMHHIEGYMRPDTTIGEQYRRNLVSRTRRKRRHHLQYQSSSSSVSSPVSSRSVSVDSAPSLAPSGDGTQEQEKKGVRSIIPNSHNLCDPPSVSFPDKVQRESFSRTGVKTAVPSSPVDVAVASGNKDDNVYAVVTPADVTTNGDHDNRHQEKHSDRCNPCTAAVGSCGVNAEKCACLGDAYTPMPLSVSGTGVGKLPDRFRMHVSIRAGKELPMVTVNHSVVPLVSPVAAIDQLENGVRSAVTPDGRLVLVDSMHRVFQPPTTFFVVEDIYSGADSRAASKGVVPDWFVEAAVRGEYDRTSVVPQSQSPQFDYECILSLPWESVFLRQAPKKSKGVSSDTVQLVPDGFTSPMTSAADTAAATCTTTTTTSIPTTSTLCLQEMRLTLWHAVVDTNGSTASLHTHENEEEKFWASTAILGECRVDLRSLRFLKVLDGWYRINAIDRADEVVGYVRVSVRVL